MSGKLSFTGPTLKGLSFIEACGCQKLFSRIDARQTQDPVWIHITCPKHLGENFRGFTISYTLPQGTEVSEHVCDECFIPEYMIESVRDGHSISMCKNGQATCNSCGHRLDGVCVECNGESSAPSAWSGPVADCPLCGGL